MLCSNRDHMRGYNSRSKARHEHYDGCRPEELGSGVTSVRTCCSCRPNSEMITRWAFRRKAPSCANTVRAGSGGDRVTISFAGVVTMMCSRVCDSKENLGKYLSRPHG